MYTIISERTALKSYPYRVSIDGDQPDHTLMHSIYTWLQSENIKYEYEQGYAWWFKKEEDVVMFKLKFGL